MVNVAQNRILLAEDELDLRDGLEKILAQEVKKSN